MIPYILHQTWKSKTELPDRFRAWQNSFLAMNPGLELRFYDDADNRALLEQVFPQLLPLYDSFRREIFRVDFIRPVYLFTAGGFYADMDVQCLKPLDMMKLEQRDLLLGRMGTDVDFLHSVPNAVMASAPGEAFWLAYMAEIEAAWESRRADAEIDERPEYVTGPVMLRQTVFRYLRDPEETRRYVLAFIARHGLAIDAAELKFSELTLVPGHVLYPINWADRIHRLFLNPRNRAGKMLSAEQAKLLFPNSVAVTYWTHSWKPDDLLPA